jgi:fibronectin type 3 domain-containing protein
MPLKSHQVVKDQGNNVVAFRNARGATYNGRVEAIDVTRGAAPAAPTAGTATTGGSLAAATYSYRLSKVLGGMETLASSAVTQVTTGATSTVTLSWTNDPSASSYNVYGRTGGSEVLLATLPAGSTGYVDTGAATPNAAIPFTVALAAKSVNIRIPGMGTIKGVQPATAMRQSNRYYVR